MNNTNIYLGTSGWSYKEWEGPFYEKGEKRKLQAYAKIFGTAEIDSTFYRVPSKGMVFGWLRYTPPDFVFTAKLPQTITHFKKLGLKGDVKPDLEEFLNIMRPLQLGGKLACLLIQLPPSYSYNPENLRRFFELLDPMFRYAVEFRHISWIRSETWSLLKEFDVAYVNVDEPLLPPDVNLTTDFTYFRWHGRGNNPWFDYNYPYSLLDAWVPKVEKASQQANKIVGYFNNHYHGYAPENCLYLIEKLGLLTNEQRGHKNKTHIEQATLGDFTH